MRIKRGRPGLGQEVLPMDEIPSSLPELYDFERAEHAADRRYEWAKKHGNLAHIRELKGKNGFLFLPHSNLENNGLHYQTEPFIKSSGDVIYGQVYEAVKAKGGTDSSAAWAAGKAKGDAVIKQKKKFKEFSNSSSFAAQIYTAVDQNDGTLSRSAFTLDRTYKIDNEARSNDVRFDILGYRSLMLYVMVREAATGSDPDVLKNGNRRWLKPHHRKFYTRSVDRSIHHIEQLPERDFVFLVDEAYFHYLGRFIYWCADESEREKYRKAHSSFIKEKTIEETLTSESYIQSLAQTE